MGDVIIIIYIWTFMLLYNMQHTSFALLVCEAAGLLEICQTLRFEISEQSHNKGLHASLNIYPCIQWEMLGCSPTTFGSEVLKLLINFVLDRYDFTRFSTHIFNVWLVMPKPVKSGLRKGWDVSNAMASHLVVRVYHLGGPSKACRLVQYFTISESECTQAPAAWIW